MANKFIVAVAAIILGGIGALVAHNTGAAYEYPSFFQVLMGQSIRVEGDPSQQTQQQATPTTATVTPAGKTVAGPDGSALQPVSTPAPSTAQSSNTEERLKELRRLHDAGLISKEVYVEQQKKAVESPR